MYINSNDKADTLRRNMKENESMKKWIVLTLALALALSLFAGCGKGADADETDYASMSIEELKPLLKTVTDGKLTVATSPDFAPYEFYSIDENENPTLVGFDIALAQYIADYLGLELEIIPMDFDGTLSELSAKKVDLALSGYSPDPAREDKMDFSDIYYVGGQSFVTVQDKADSFSTLADANKAEYQIGAQLGSIQADLAKENTPDADIVELSKVTDIIAELLSGMKTPTVSLVLGGGHSIGVPLAVSTRYSFIAPTATMTVHPVRMNGVMLGVPQTLSYFDKMQERITGFVTANSRIRPEKFRELMMNNGELVMDIGTVLDGEGAVQVGLIDELGGLQNALGKLYDLIDEEDGRKKPRRGRPPKAKLDKEPPAKGAAK